MEVAFALSIKPTEGFTRPLQTALCFVLGAGSVYLLTPALTVLGSLVRQYPDRGLRDSLPR